MIIDDLKQRGYNVVQDSDKDSYKILLARPEKCSKCGFKMVSVGMTKPRRVVDWDGENAFEITLRHSRYRCANRSCQAYAYKGRSNPMHGILEQSAKISDELKRNAVRMKICNPAISMEEISKDYGITRNTLRNAMKDLFRKAKSKIMMRPLDCERLIFYPITHNEHKYCLLFGVNSEMGICELFDIVEAKNIISFLKQSIRLIKSRDEKRYLKRVIWGYDLDVLLEVQSAFDEAPTILLEQEYERLEKSLLRRHGLFAERLREIKAKSMNQSEFEQRCMRYLPQPDADYIKRVGIYWRSHCNEYEINRMVFFDLLQQILDMLTHNVPVDEIVIRLAFMRKYYREQLEEHGFGEYII